VFRSILYTHFFFSSFGITFLLYQLAWLLYTHFLSRETFIDRLTLVRFFTTRSFLCTPSARSIIPARYSDFKDRDGIVEPTKHDLGTVHAELFSSTAASFCHSSKFRFLEHGNARSDSCQAHSKIPGTSYSTPVFVVTNIMSPTLQLAGPSTLYTPLSDVLDRHDYGITKNRKPASTGGGRAWSEDEVRLPSAGHDEAREYL
jgi:hypothetical protein